MEMSTTTLTASLTSDVLSLLTASLTQEHHYYCGEPLLRGSKSLHFMMIHLSKWQSHIRRYGTFSMVLEMLNTVSKFSADCLTPRASAAPGRQSWVSVREFYVITK